jgi:hypothetical protein
MHTHSEDWISIAEQVTVEMDSTKLASLVEQLCHALDYRGRSVDYETKNQIEQTVASCPGVSIVGWK